MTQSSHTSMRLGLLAVAFVLGSTIAPLMASAATMQLSGFAWSSGLNSPFMGWINFGPDGTSPGVKEDTSNGALSGYAWSSNLGWIKFDGVSDTSHPAPSVNLATGDITGWVRACSAFANPASCSGTLDSKSGGWDGWINLAPGSAPWGIKQTTSGNTCVWNGYAWGSDAIGVIGVGTAINPAYGPVGNASMPCPIGPAVDLMTVPNSTSVSASPVVNQPISFSATILNNGDVPATNFPNIFQVATGDPINDTNTIKKVAATQVPSLAPHAEYDISASNYTISSPGTYYVRACADLDTSGVGSVAESNVKGDAETNNCGTPVPFVVGAGTCPATQFYDKSTSSCRDRYTIVVAPDAYTVTLPDTPKPATYSLANTVPTDPVICQLLDSTHSTINGAGPVPCTGNMSQVMAPYVPTQPGEYGYYISGNSTLGEAETSNKFIVTVVASAGCVAPLVWDSNALACVQPLLVEVAPALYTTTLPNPSASITYTVKNGSPGAECWVMDYMGVVRLTPKVDCTSTAVQTAIIASANMPTTTGDFGYFMQAFKTSTGETKTSPFTIRVNAPLACTNGSTNADCSCVSPSTEQGGVCKCTNGAIDPNGGCKVCADGNIYDGAKCIPKFSIKVDPPAYSTAQSPVVATYTLTNATLKDPIMTCRLVDWTGTNYLSPSALCTGTMPMDSYLVGKPPADYGYYIVGVKNFTNAPIEIHLSNKFVVTVPAAVCNSPAQVVNGTCTCPLPATTVNGVCTCAAPAKMVNGVCSCVAPATIAANGTCTCNAPNTIVSGVCTAPAGVPDLTVLPDLAPRTAVVGAATVFTATIKNQGNGSTGKGFPYLYQRANTYDSNTKAVTGVENIGSWNIASALAAGATVSAPLTYGYAFRPEDVGLTRYLRVCADLNTSFIGAVIESNATGNAEDNNCGEWTPIQVTAASCTGGMVGNPCACPAGQIWDAATQSCITGSCPFPKTPNAYGVCTCQAPATPINNNLDCACLPPASNVNGVCVSTGRSGSIYFDPSSCVIPVGGSTCQSRLVWSTNNVASPVVKRSANPPVTYSSQPSGDGAYSCRRWYIPPAARIAPYYASTDDKTYMILYDGTEFLASAKCTVSCAPGSTWGGTNNTECVSTASACTAPAQPVGGVCTCTNGAINPNAGCDTCDATHDYFGGVCVPKDLSCPLPWGGTLPNGQSVTAYSTERATPPATCDDASQVRVCTDGVLGGDTMYNKQSCTNDTVIPPTATISASPTLLPKNGGAVIITWQAQNVLTSCQIKKGAATWDQGQNLLAVDKVSSGTITDTIAKQTVYGIYCDGGSLLASVTVNVAGDFSEF